MKTRNRKKRNRWLGGLRILVYMNTEKEQKKVHWFSVMRIVVIIWNIFTYIYHLEEIEMNILTNSIQHIVGMLIEYFIAGIYENSIIRINKFINKKILTHTKQKIKKILIKFLSFGIVFSTIYTVVYILRMIAIYAIGGEFKTGKAIIISTIAGFILGPVTASLILWARKKRLKVKITKKIPNNSGKAPE